MTTVAVLQSNYLPWRGYFDLIHDVDLFVFYDEVQYTKNDWRNRNRVYSQQGLSWLTLPCGYNLKQTVLETRIKNELPWPRDHWNKINNAYGKSDFFHLYRDFFEHVYFERQWDYLFQLNRFLIKTIASDFLHISTEFADSRDYASSGSRADKLLSLLMSIGCDVYISGPAAQSYLPVERFYDAGIKVIWKDYSGYPTYKQQKEPFEGAVSVIDLLFNTGPEAPALIWGGGSDNSQKADGLPAPLRGA